MHRAMIRNFRDESPGVRRERRAILLAGPPGAGKTTALSQILDALNTTPRDWRVLNADDFKDRLLKLAIDDGSYAERLTPAEVIAIENEGEKVWPRERAALVHEESSMIMKLARDQAIRLGENIIIDGTLSNSDTGSRLVAHLEENRYVVQIVLVDGPRNVTEARVDYRWSQGYESAVNKIPSIRDENLLVLGGRWVPSEVIDALYSQGDEQSICKSAASTIAESSLSVDQIDEYRITEPAGKPKLVEQRIGKSASGRWSRTRAVSYRWKSDGKPYPL